MKHAAKAARIASRRLRRGIAVSLPGAARRRRWYPGRCQPPAAPGREVITVSTQPCGVIGLSGRDVGTAAVGGGAALPAFHLVRRSAAFQTSAAVLPLRNSAGTPVCWLTAAMNSGVISPMMLTS